MSWALMHTAVYCLISHCFSEGGGWVRGWISAQAMVYMLFIILLHRFVLCLSVTVGVGVGISFGN